MKTSVLILAAVLAFPVMAQHKHVHGEGRLDVAIEGERLMLDLQLPMDAAVGFERPPRNDSEKAALANAEKRLHDAATLWRPTPAAACTPEAASVEMPRLAGEGHVDITARYVFRCATPAALKGVETTLFVHFKRLYRLETQRVGPTGQGAQRLTPKRPALSW